MDKKERVLTIEEALRKKGKTSYSSTSIKDILDMPVIVDKISTEPSRFRENETVLRIEGRYYGGTERFCVVTGSKVIMDKLLAVRDLLPVSGKFIRPRGKRYYDFV